MFFKYIIINIIFCVNDIEIDINDIEIDIISVSIVLVINSISIYSSHINKNILIIRPLTIYLFRFYYLNR